MAVSALLLLVAADAWLAGSWQRFGDVLGPLVRRGSLIPPAFTLLMLAGAAEFIRLMRAVGLRPHAWWAKIMVAAMMLTPWFCAAWSTRAGLIDIDGLPFQSAWLVAAVIGTALIQLWRGASERTIADVAATLLVIVYCGFLPSFLILLRCDENLPIPQGAWLVLLFLAVTKASDIGAYFTGSAIGRHKLVPAISPGKTVEGTLGGVAASLLVALALRSLAVWAADSPASGLSSDSPSYSGVAEEVLFLFSTLSITQVSVFAIVMSAIGQLGDLLESLFKRAAAAKNSATLIPAFGGVLDIVDSPVLAAPVAWFLLTHLFGLV